MNNIIKKIISICKKEENLQNISMFEVGNIAKKLKIDFSKTDFTIDDLLEGTQTEFNEHQSVHHGNITISVKIALDHLKETKDYYKKLAKANL